MLHTSFQLLATRTACARDEPWICVQTNGFTCNASIVGWHGTNSARLKTRHRSQRTTDNDTRRAHACPMAFDVLCRINSAFVLCHGKRPADFPLFGTTINCCCCGTNRNWSLCWKCLISSSNTPVHTQAPPARDGLYPRSLSVQLDMNHFTKVHFTFGAENSRWPTPSASVLRVTLLGGTVDSFLLASLVKYDGPHGARGSLSKCVH